MPRLAARFIRAAPRLAAFAAGAALPLVLAALAGTAFNGGLSDVPATPAVVYPL
ncbi:MAG TPA: hypothetical protein PKD10_19150 [Paracoccaceae bacterium]|nr:hypothetical protein [Paracoccaceae bacterium]HMO73394.1 hypothetical protein [Paracoccaceae bacterium]